MRGGTLKCPLCGNQTAVVKRDKWTCSPCQAAGKILNTNHGSHLAVLTRPARPKEER